MLETLISLYALFENKLSKSYQQSNKPQCGIMQPTYIYTDCTVSPLTSTACKLCQCQAPTLIPCCCYEPALHSTTSHYWTCSQSMPASGKKNVFHYQLCYQGVQSPAFLSWNSVKKWRLGNRVQIINAGVMWQETGSERYCRPVFIYFLDHIKNNYSTLRLGVQNSTSKPDPQKY